MFGGHLVFFSSWRYGGLHGWHGVYLFTSLHPLYTPSVSVAKSLLNHIASSCPQISTVCHFTLENRCGNADLEHSRWGPLDWQQGEWNQV